MSLEQGISKCCVIRLVCRLQNKISRLHIPILALLQIHRYANGPCSPAQFITLDYFSTADNFYY